MGLDDFLGGVAVKPRPVERPSGSELPVAAGESGTAETPVSALGADGTTAAGRVPASTSQEGLSTDETPQGVVEIELPSGIEVYYQSAPKRLYRIRRGLFTGDKAEPVEWAEVPSMSTVSKILDKPGLVSWGEQVGINLVQELLRQGHVDEDFAKRFQPNERQHPPWFGGAHLQEIGKTKKLTNYYMRDAAAARGDSVHNALEGWAMSGTLMDPEAYPEHERGYVQGLNKFLSESRYEPLKSEVIVASIEHMVAGRFDLSGRIPQDVELVYHLTEKNEKRKVFPAASSIVDLKTSSGVFNDHHLQVAGYKGVMVESGYEEPERGYILRVTDDGRYELVDLSAEWLDFWFLRGLYDSLRDIKERSHQDARKALS